MGKLLPKWVVAFLCTQGMICVVSMKSMIYTTCI
jgi:hypothetical protein